jgi:hypothetical protein
MLPRAVIARGLAPVRAAPAIHMIAIHAAATTTAISACAARLRRRAVASIGNRREAQSATGTVAPIRRPSRTDSRIRFVMPRLEPLARPTVTVCTAR